MESTKRRNINRGYMKLEVWNHAIGLLALLNEILKSISRLDLAIPNYVIPIFGTSAASQFARF